MIKWTALFALLLAAPLAAQTNIDLGGITTNPNAPVEVAADSLSVDQETGTAIFEGNVVIGQGDLRIGASRAQVVYDGATGNIASFEASGGVTFATATEAAEAQNANYDLINGKLVLTGDVILTQGPSALSADRMTIDVKTGNAQMEGRVRTVFQQGN
ncbi:lipopolysaccharide transport periplasmic protein LptA [Yoonia sp.]|uniref:lipopolysaccharide transport periplasmic protein LptA n=1 Tax=Yoonia sp. TaxID=2212373 RepID=UPI0023897551|nr:lipopolysaccharide transport periplasmic protein LptA [Yoonia sp.]MDE0850073.1 lipopolysaccharide transport periplasmic protein LptA [Yoonia sp.]